MISRHLSPHPTPHHPRLNWETQNGDQSPSSGQWQPWEGSRAGGSCTVAMATPGLLTKAVGDGGPVATNTQQAGPPGRPSLRAARSLGLLRAEFLKRKDPLEAGLFFLGFPPEGHCWVLWSHLWLRSLQLLWGRREKLSQATNLEEKEPAAQHCIGAGPRGGQL